MTTEPDVQNVQQQDDENLPGQGGTPTLEGTPDSVVNPVIDNQLAYIDRPGDIDNQPADDAILVAVTSVFSDTVPNIEHTLDQLTVATDLFDVPPLDLDTAASS
jgi:hypothetical protein